MANYDDYVLVRVFGDKGVGKRTILSIFSEENFVDGGSYSLTEKILNYEERRVRLRLITFSDTEFAPLLAYERDVVCFVYDMTNKNTFQRIREMEQDLEQRYTATSGLWKTRTKILLANKIDLHARRTVSGEEGQSFAQSIDATYFEVEAKSISSVENVMRMIVILRQSEVRRQGKPVPKEKYSVYGHVKYWLLGETEKTKATKSAGDRDFHLRCAKTMQNVQELDKIDVSHSKRDDDVPPCSAFTEKPLPGCTDRNNLEAYQDKLQETETKERESGTFQAYQQTSCTATSESHHRVWTENDLTEALKKAKTLTAKQSNRKATVSFYDFAGQLVFHASHPTFLSPSAIYILTFDLQRILQKSNSSDVSFVERDKLYGDRRGAIEVSDLDSIIFWLNLIYMFDAVKSEIHPHVILVGTHGDKIPKENREAIAANFFKEVRNAIAESPFNTILSETEFIVDNSKKNDKMYSWLKTEIFELAKLQSSWGEKTPAKWLPLDREIQLRKESGFKVLAVEELKTINRGLEVKISNDTEMDSFLLYLNQIGDVIYYNAKPLSDKVVLDPVWFINALKTVITADKFALRTPTLAKQWKEFSESGVICCSAIVSIFEKNKEDPSLFENHEHVIRLMEKFLFIAAPVGFHNDLDANNDETKKDIRYIIPCMVHKEADTNLITRLEGLSRTSVFCLVAMNNCLPPAIFQKLLAMCITRWPIVEQQGAKLIFCGVCKFNLDEPGHFKLTVFLVNYAVHARIVSFVDKEQPHHAVCQPVQEFLVQSFRSILQAMGFSDDFRQCIQCPQYSPADCGGYLDINHMINQAAVTCDKCQDSHVLKVKEILGGWIDMKQDETEPTGVAADGCVGQEKVRPG